MNVSYHPNHLLSQVQHDLAHGSVYMAHEWEGGLIQLEHLHTALCTILAPLQTLDASLGWAEQPHFIFRIAFRIPAIDPWSWLTQQEQAVRTYWKDRSDRFSFAGIGSADSIQSTHSKKQTDAFENLQHALETAPPHLRYTGGFRFSEPAYPSAAWGAFGASWWNLSQVEILHYKDETFSRCNVHIKVEAKHSFRDSIQATLNSVQALKTPTEQPTKCAPVRLTQRADRPDQKHWSRNIQHAQDLFGEQHLEKVVFARETTFQMEPQEESVSSSTSHSSSLTQWISALRENSKETYIFYFQPQKDVAFLGATPERLFKQSAQTITTEALAGTRPRSPVENEDAALATELMSSAKERNEQHLVHMEIERHLSVLCKEWHAPEHPSIRKLEHVQHLQTILQGQLNEHSSSLDALRALHPTPAVAGLPKQAACDTIESLEPFDRGWYAAPIGWISRSEVEFAVAIRSALCTEHSIRLFAGAGIVPGSQAQQEWNELSYKLRPFLTLPHVTQ